MVEKIRWDQKRQQSRGAVIPFPSSNFSSRGSTEKLECNGDETQDLMACLPLTAPCEGRSLPKHSWEPALISGNGSEGKLGNGVP